MGQIVDDEAAIDATDDTAHGSDRLILESEIGLQHQQPGLPCHDRRDHDQHGECGDPHEQLGQGEHARTIRQRPAACEAPARPGNLASEL